MKAHEFFGQLLSVTHWLLHFLVLLIARHWMTGLSNLGMTVLLGLALLKAAPFLRFRAQTVLRLRRIVLLSALFKGAFYLVLGESMHAPPSCRWFIGIQIPDPSEAAGLMAQTGYSIWHPTAITEWISLVLGLSATAYLLVRSAQFLLVKRCVQTAAGIHQPTADARSDALLQSARRALGVKTVPRLVQVELPEWGIQSLCPLLLDLRDPLLVFSPRLADELNDAEMEMVLRHEMAHLVRRDHWWRWALLWVVDVGSLTILNIPVKSAVISLEEQLCDRLAVQSPQDAVALASALRKTLALMEEAGGGGRRAAEDGEQQTPSLTEAVTAGTIRAVPAPPRSAVPLLLGAYAASWQDLASLRSRMTGLLDWSRELATRQTPKPEAHSRAIGDGHVLPIPRFRPLGRAGGLLRPAARLAFFLLLGVILYAKFYLGLNLR